MNSGYVHFLFTFRRKPNKTFVLVKNEKNLLHLSIFVCQKKNLKPTNQNDFQRKTGFLQSCFNIKKLQNGKKIMIFLSLPFWLKISILVNSFLPLSPSMSLTRIYSPFFSLFSTRVHICVPSLFTLHHPKVRILSIFEMSVLNRKLKYKDSLWDGNWFEVKLKKAKQILNIEFILLKHVSNEKFEILNIRGCKDKFFKRVKY